VKFFNVGEIVNIKQLKMIQDNSSTKTVYGETTNGLWIQLYNLKGVSFAKRIDVPS
jgi:hypothetical protein